jgi:hypothetical protein
LEVKHTYKRQGFVLRRLSCLECGDRTTTVERPVNEPLPSATAIGSTILGMSIGQFLEMHRQQRGSPSRPENTPEN